MSNYNFKELNIDESHIFKIGEFMEKKYGTKKVTISFIYNENGKSFKEIIESSYRNEIRKEKILTGGNSNELQKN